MENPRPLALGAFFMHTVLVCVKIQGLWDQSTFFMHTGIQTGINR